MKRAQAVYDNDQRLFVAVLDALCLGQVGEFATLAEMCGSAGAVAAVARTPKAWRLLRDVEGAVDVLLSSPSFCAVSDIIAEDAWIMSKVWSRKEWLASAIRSMPVSEKMYSAVLDDGDDARYLLLADMPEALIVSIACDMAGVEDSYDGIESLSEDAGALNAVVENKAAAALLARSDAAMALLASSEDILSKLLPGGSADEAAISMLSGSAVAMRRVCLSERAKTKWMESDYGHTCFDKVRDTLANAHGLFDKKLDYWDSDCPEVTSPMCTLGNITTSNWYQTVRQISGAYVTSDNSWAVANSSIVLLREVSRKSIVSSSYHEIIGSSQTHTEDLIVSYQASAYETASKVYLGGMSTRSDYNGGQHNDFIGKFEIYVPKEET